MKNLFCRALLFSGIFMLAGSTIDAYGMRGSEALRIFREAAWVDEADYVDVSDPHAVIAVSKHDNPELYQKLKENVLSSLADELSLDSPGTYIRLKSINDLKCEGAHLLDGVHNGSYIVLYDEDAGDIRKSDYCEVTDSDYVEFLDYCIGNKAEEENEAYDELVSSARRLSDGRLHVSIEVFKKMFKKLNKDCTRNLGSYKSAGNLVKPGNYVKHRSEIICIDE